VRERPVRIANQKFADVAQQGENVGAPFLLDEKGQQCPVVGVRRLAQVGIGASPDGATTWWLPRIVGARRAKEIALLGQRFGATDALQMGLVNQVVPDAGLDEAVDALIGRLISAPAESVRRTKRLLDLSLQNDLERQLELEAQSFGACAATEDFVEGVRAFIGKRPAKFNQTTG